MQYFVLLPFDEVWFRLLPGGVLYVLVRLVDGTGVGALLADSSTFAGIAQTPSACLPCMPAASSITCQRGVHTFLENSATALSFMPGVVCLLFRPSLRCRGLRRKRLAHADAPGGLVCCVSGCWPNWLNAGRGARAHAHLPRARTFTWRRAGEKALHSSLTCSCSTFFPARNLLMGVRAFCGWFCGFAISTNALFRAFLFAPFWKAYARCGAHTVSHIFANAWGGRGTLWATGRPLAVAVDPPGCYARCLVRSSYSLPSTTVCTDALFRTI